MQLRQEVRKEREKIKSENPRHTDMQSGGSAERFPGEMEKWGYPGPSIHYVG